MQITNLVEGMRIRFVVLGLPRLEASDGPLGVHKSNEPTTMMTAGIALAATWNPALAETDLERLYAVNVRGMFLLTKAFLPSMIERHYGVIINTASIGGVVAVKDRLAYCTTKFAVVGFSKCIALDHALQGIRSNAICPGRVETPFVKKRISEYADPQKAYAEMAATQAVGRMATPEEIAAAVLYLASDEAAFVTGTAFEIDGGFSVGK